jgi:LuxR family maltose regulon positive regulatory protein/serine/threonine-protein kinase PknK
MFLRADSDREWFRYHHLFASYLRRRLERDHPDRIAELHRAASGWFAKHGFLSEAVTHPLSAGDETVALDLVEQRAMNLVEHSRMATLLGLIKKLPQFRLPERPTLQIAIGWANCLLQRPDPAQTALHYVRAAVAPGDERDRELLSVVDVVQTALSLARETAGQHSHAASLASAFLGRLLYERGDINAAEELLEECHLLGAESGVADFMIATYTILARIRTLRGDSEEAWSLLDEGRQVGRQLRLPRLLAAVDHERVRLHLSLGQIGAAECVVVPDAEEIPTGHDGIAMAIRHEHLGMRARIRAANGDYETALRMLSQNQRDAAAVGWRYAEAAAGIEMAVVHSLSGNSDTAIRTAVPVLATAARTGLLRTITDTGPGLVKLIGAVQAAARENRLPADLNHRVPADYLSRLLGTVQADGDQNTPAGVARSAPNRLTPDEPLTAREVDLLRLLDRGLSNKEIARNLNVTINTVKWYLKSIYLKLDVARRGEAVAEARRRTILT